MNENHTLRISNNNFNVLILCGGMGSRISKITKKTPKPLIKVLNKPFLFYLIKNLSRYNFGNFYLLTHYRHKKFEQFKKKFQKILNVKINIIKEKEKLDTGGAVINALNKIKNKKDYMLVNGDTYLDIDYYSVINKFNKKKTFTIPLVKSSKFSEKLNSINIAKNEKIYFSKKSEYMNSGVCLFKKKNLKKHKEIKTISFENNILKNQIKLKKVFGYVFPNNFIDIGSYSSLKKIQNFIKKKYLKKNILFLDRDNTLNLDYGYTHKIRDLNFINKNIQYINKHFKNYIKVLISNQAGIGKKKFSLNSFKIFMKKFISELEREKIFLSKIYYCPHHKSALIQKYKKSCRFRKPNTGMIDLALKDLDITNNKGIIFIGNDINDSIVAKRKKIKFINQNKIN